MAAQQPKSGGIIEGINVTPLVDITLVLLIIFIVTAKMVVAPAVPLDLPQASQGEEVQTIFAVAIAKDGAVSIDGKPTSTELLGARAREALAKDKELRAVIHADGDVSHRRVIDVLDRLKEAGLTRVAFGTVQRVAGAPAGGGTEVHPSPTPTEATRAEPAAREGEAAGGSAGGTPP